MSFRCLIAALVLLGAPCSLRSVEYFGTAGTIWKLFKGRAEASVPDAAAWRQPAFNDSSWSAAPAPVYYTQSPSEPPFWDGGPVIGTVLDDMFTNYTCVFLRKTFLVTNAPASGAVTIQIAADDGFILWLNGVEVGRTNMPAGTIAFDGRALVSVSEPVSVHAYVLTNGGSWLREGTNVLAVQAFNWDPGSGDFAVMAGLSTAGTNPPIAGCVTPAADLAQWWPLDGSGEDTAGTAALTLSGGPVFGAAKVAQGLIFDGVNDQARATASAALNLGTAPGLTIECWIRPTDASRLMDIVEWNNSGGGIGVHISTSTGSSRDLYANIVDTAGTTHNLWSASGLLQDGVFQHVALTYDKAAGRAVLYWNGAQVASAALGTFTPQTSYDFYVGNRVSGPFQGILFAGVIDELSCYRRSLSQAEIQSIFAAGAAGKCSAPRPLAIVTQPQGATVMMGGASTFSVLAQGTAPLRYQWRLNGSALAGATQSALSLNNIQPQQAGAYSVVVSDASGSVTSAPAILDVIVPLAILSPPQNLMSVVGGAAGFSVVAQSTSPLSYQWLFNGTSIPGAHAATLSLANVQTHQAGRYSVRVSNTSQSLTSAPAVLTVLVAGLPLITEFMAENDGGLLDEDGDGSDWLEIFNPGPGSVNLLEWCLTDHPANLTKWRFPATNLAANGYLLVFASGKNRALAGAPLHANFRLDQDGSFLALVQPDGRTVVSSFTPAYPHQRANISYGLSGGPVYFPEPTPGAANNLGVLGYVDDTKFSTNRGFFFAPIDVTLTCATPGATLVFSTNGAEPALTEGVVVPPLTATSAPSRTLRFDTTTTLRAAAFKEGWVPANVDTHTYVFPARVVGQVRPAGASTTWIDDPPGNGGSYPADFTVDAAVVDSTLPGFSFTNALMAVPTVSVVTPVDGLFGPANGIYTHAFKQGTNWERRASVELIHPDGRPGFQVDAGARMHGGVSRLNDVTPKHPLRLVFRDSYGASKLEHPLFGDSAVRRFDQLVLRACSTDSWGMANNVDFLWRNYDATYQRDQWMRDAQLDLGHPSAHGVYVHLYLNGLYWGLYNLTERPNESFAADHLGGNKDDYDMVADYNGELIAGSRAPWEELLALADRAPADATALTRMQGLNLDGTRNTNFPVLIDMTNFIDYMALHIYAAAVDWPLHNWWAARRRGPESEGYRFFVWDQEVAIDRLDRTITWATNKRFEEVDTPGTPGQIYDGLRRDPEFKLQFADRLQKHFFNGGALTVASNRARWSRRAAEINQAIVGESARFGDAHHTPAYRREGDWLRMSNWTQNTYWTANLPIAWQRFRNVGLYPATTAPMFNQHGGAVPAGFALTLTHSNAGGVIHYTLDGSDPRLRGGGVRPAALTYAAPVVLTSPTLVRARVKSGADWSALVEAQFSTPQDLTRLQLSEIMYNPPKFGTNDGDEVEFLELQNTGGTPLDLGGLAFIAGIQFVFPPDTLLEPGGFFVLARNPALFAERYPGAPLHGTYSGKLDNNGEWLALALPPAALVFALAYDNAAPWPAEADNSGLSLQRMSFLLAATNAAAWLAAAPTPGGPLPADYQDRDGDSLPDGWELANGLQTALPDGDADPDHDGMSNRAEFLAGTDPQDAEDALRLQALETRPVPGGWAVVLGFPARAYKTYSIVERSSFVTAWNPLLTVSAQPTNQFVRLTNVVVSIGNDSRFYQLVTPRLP